MLLNLLFCSKSANHRQHFTSSTVVPLKMTEISFSPISVPQVVSPQQVVRACLSYSFIAWAIHITFSCLPFTSCVPTLSVLAPLYVILADALLHKSSALQTLQKSFPADTVSVSLQEILSPSVMDGVTDR